MKPLVRLLALIVALTFALTVQAGRPPVPIINHDGLPIQPASGKTLTAEEFRSLITLAGSQLNPPWQFTVAPDGHLIGTLMVKSKHSISIDINYSANQFSIHYKDSFNMGYTTDTVNLNNPMPPQAGPFIHPNYNRWVNSLIKNINRENARY